MRRIFEFFTRRHILATLFTLMIILLGINSVRTLQRDRFPNVDWGWVDILTEYPGASPEDVELNVTNKIEDALLGISGIKDVYSLSVENVSNVYVQIDPDARDKEKVKSNIRDAVGRITDFPEDVTESPYIEESTTATDSILAVGVAGDLTYAELREIASWKRSSKQCPVLRDLRGLDTVLVKSKLKLIRMQWINIRCLLMRSCRQ